MGRHHNSYRILAAALAIGFISACSGGSGGGGGGGGNVLPPQPRTAPPVLPPMHLGLALFGDDSHGTGFLQVLSLYDTSGKILATPKRKIVPAPSMFDYEDTSIAPNASFGIALDGGHLLRVIGGLATGNPNLSGATLDVTPYGNDVDAVRVLPNGDEAVVAADASNALLLISGLLSGKPVAAASIPTPDLKNGLALSSDGKVLLARGYSGVTVYDVESSTPAQGAYGGWTYHSFTQTQNLTSLPPLDAADARAGMALSPADSGRAVVVGSGAAISLITGLPGAAQVATVPIAGANNAFAAAISPDGTTAFVGTEKGIAVFSGVNTGTLTQVQSVIIPATAGDSVQQITTLAVTSDGADLVVAGLSALAPAANNGYLAVLPIAGGKLGAPVGLLPGVTVPDDDQMLVQ